MAGRHFGREGSLKFGSNTLGKFKDWKIQMSAKTVDATDSGSSGAEESLASTTSWSGSFSAFYVDDDVPQTALRAALTAGTVLAAEFYPEGNTSAKTKLAGNVIITSWDLGAASEELAMMNVSFKGTAALTESQTA